MRTNNREANVLLPHCWGWSNGLVVLFVSWMMIINNMNAVNASSSNSISRTAFDLFTSTTFMMEQGVDDIDNETAWEKLKSLQCFFLQSDIEECTSTEDIDGETILCSYCTLSEEGMEDAGLSEDDQEQGPMQICVPSFTSQTLLDNNKVVTCMTSPLPAVLVPPPIDLPPPPIKPDVTSPPFDADKDTDGNNDTMDKTDIIEIMDDDVLTVDDNGNVTNSMLDPNMTMTLIAEGTPPVEIPAIDVLKEPDTTSLPFQGLNNHKENTNAVVVPNLVVAGEVPALLNVTAPTPKSSPGVLRGFSSNDNNHVPVNRGGSHPPPMKVPATAVETSNNVVSTGSPINHGGSHPPIWMSINRPLMKLLWPRLLA